MADSVPAMVPSADEHRSAGWRSLLGQPQVRRGVAGAVLMFSCLGLLVLLALPPFLPADESAHAGYALEVMDGRLPTLDDTVEAELPGQRSTPFFLANHPPLYYIVVGPVLEWGLLTDHAVAGVRLTRLFSLVLGAGTIVFTALLTGLMSSERRVMTVVLASGLAASVPTFVATSIAMHNDLLAIAAAVGAYLAVLWAIATRPRSLTVALVCVGASVTLATRFNGLGVVALACVGLALAALVRSSGRLVPRLWQACVLAALPAVCVLATSGWFYLRNLRLYGDINGIGYNRGLSQRTDVFTPWSWLTHWRTFPDLLTRVEGGGPWAGIQWFGWYDRKLLLVAVVVVGFGGLLAAGRGVRTMRSFDWREMATGTGAQARDLRARVVMWGLAIALPVLMLVQLSGFVGQTGTPNPRYLLPALPIVALLVAMACRGYPGRSAALVGMAVVSLQAGLTVTTIARYITSRTGQPRTAPLRQLRTSLEAADIPTPGLVLGLLLAGAAIGVLLQFSAAWSASRGTRDDADPAGIRAVDVGSGDDGPVGEVDGRDEVDRARGEAGVVVGIGMEQPRPAVVE
jgi:hypothetical protein